MNQIAQLRTWWSAFASEPPGQPWALVHGTSVDLRDTAQPLVRHLKSAGVHITSDLNVNAAADQGADLILLLDCSPSLAHCAALVSEVTGEDFVELVGSLPDREWMQTIAQVRDLLETTRRSDRTHALSPSLQRTVQELDTAQRRRVPVVLGGLTEVSAALLSQGSWQVAHEGARPAHRVAVRQLKLHAMVSSGSDEAIASALGFSSMLSALRM